MTVFLPCLDIDQGMFQSLFLWISLYDIRYDAEKSQFVEFQSLFLWISLYDAYNAVFWRTGYNVSILVLMDFPV